MAETFSIVISGVFIFVIQKIISDIWIAPRIDFQKSLARIEVLVIRANKMFRHTEGEDNNMVTSEGIPFNQYVKVVRKKINLATFKLIESYNSLFFLDKIWLKIRGRHIHKSIPELLSLSVFISSKKDWKGERAISEEKINNISNYLKLNKDFLES
jgi:hypothetical protein